MVYVEIVHIFFYILFQGKERPAKTKIMPAKKTPYSVGLSEVGLRALLVNLGFSKHLFDSAQC